jgi:hypothetical protein
VSRRIAVVAGIELAVIALLGAIARAQPPSIPVAPMSGTVSGVVHDSVARAPLRGVMVNLVRVDEDSLGAFFATSDSAGRYTIANVPPGMFMLTFFSIASDTLGIEPAARPLRVNAGPQRVDLAIPSPKTVIRALCPSGAFSDSTGLLIGHVQRSDDEAPLEGASVIVEWTETVVQGVLIEEETRRAVATTKGPGWFAICDLPSDVVLSARASSGADSSGYLPVQVPAGDLRHLTVRIGGATIVPIPRLGGRKGDDSTTVLPAPTVLRGRARLSGTVRDDKGKPVANARALVWGTNLEAVTNSRGSFVLDSLPGGTHTLEVRHIRHAMSHAIVQLAAQRPATIDVVIAPRAVELAPVTVRSQLAYSRNLTDFDARRAEGWELVGQFLGPADLEKRPNTRLGNLLQEMPGVYIDNRRGGAAVRMRGSGGNSYCTPSLYVDGVRDPLADFNSFDSNEIAAIEVYPRETGRPSEFMDGNECGSVIVWRRTPIARMKDPPG